MKSWNGASSLSVLLCWCWATMVVNCFVYTPLVSKSLSPQRVVFATRSAGFDIAKQEFVTSLVSPTTTTTTTTMTTTTTGEQPHNSVYNAQESAPLLPLVAKRSIDDIMGIVRCVNECSIAGANFTMKGANRANAKIACDWDKFKRLVPEYVNDVKLLRNNAAVAENWVIFHMRKRDLQFINGDEWVWQPRRKKRKVRVTRSVSIYRR